MRLVLLIVITFALAFACGNKTNRQNLGADEYFEYAKKKFDDGKYLSAITEFTVIVLKFGGNPVIDDAQYYLAESQFKQGEYLVAISEFQKLANDYPQSPYYVLAQFKVGLSFHKLSLRPSLDQDYTKRALRAFQAFTEEHPQHELRADAEKMHKKLREKLAEKKLIGATTYRKMGVYDSAVIYYDLLLSDYFDSPLVAEALYYKAECQFKLKEYELSQSTYTIFVEKFPKHKFANKSKKQLGKLLDLIQDVKNDEQTNTADNQ